LFCIVEVCQLCGWYTAFAARSPSSSLLSSARITVLNIESIKIHRIAERTRVRRYGRSKSSTADGVQKTSLVSSSFPLA